MDSQTGRINKKQIFNRDDLHHRLGSDPELISMVIGVFIDDMPQQIKALKEAVKIQDAKEATRLAHSIKGAAANVGGESLQAAALKLEEAGREGNLPDMAMYLPELEQEVLQLTGILKREQ